MTHDWKCYNCGEPAEYSNGKKKFCVKAWNVYLKFKDKNFMCKGKDQDGKKDKR